MKVLIRTALRRSNMMRAQLGFGCVAAALLVASTGCSVGKTSAHVTNAGKTFMLMQDFGPTLTQSKADHMHSINAVMDRDARAFFHDLDLLYQTERPTRLTPWHDR